MKFDINNLYEQNIKEFEEIDNIINNEGVSLFGAALYGINSLEYMINNNYNVNYIIDNDINKQNKKIKNILIIPKDKINSLSINSILVSAMGSNVTNEILELIQPYNIKSMSFNKWFIMKNYKELIKLKEYLFDDKSKYVFDVLLYSKLSYQNLVRNIFENNQYFAIPEFNFYDGNEILLDAGAFVGDTSEKFIYNNFGIFKHIYAFEPGLKQLNAMKIRFNRLKEEFAIDDNKISIINKALSYKNDKLYLNTSVTFSGYNITQEKSEEIIDVISIDNFLDGNPITFLKSDIEGEEFNMLKGAENTIKKYKPKMAISVYHRPDDLLTIPKYIKELVPEYNFSLRHHSLSFNDTVLYCWVNKDQTRPDQTRPDQTRPVLICKEYIYSNNIRIIEKLQPMLQDQIAA